MIRKISGKRLGEEKMMKNSMSPYQNLVKSIAEATNPDDIHSLPVPETLARYINPVVASRLLLINL